ncbi:lipase family protein [Aeromicrobium sp. Root472D3]|uniref:lipase family protein n=1 Tax=Aeromicrobium sp. Root472D3 TaxID=1736540 RepID=UPI000701A285|nr:lipase family protein [Aeromicrobium sp. Root472D3]KQX75541.1 lipase [Aeromicrobium sp. Root472D3]
MRIRHVITGAIAAALTSITLTSTPATAADGDFYTPPSDVTGQPGDVIRSEPSVFYLDPLKAIKADARVQRLMYVSTTARGRKDAVTGTMITPRAPWVGKGERPLISFAVGTQGMADTCAPSRQLAAGSEYEGLFIKGLLLRGYAVVVTDYEGLGTPGTHAYVNSTALGRNVLDAARAATRLGTDRVSATAPVFIAGYSEGGNASAGALEQHRAYAPDVNVTAGYAGAVPADLTKVAPNLDGSLYAAFLLYSVTALDATYPELGIPSLLNAAGKAALARADTTCTFDGVAAFPFTRSSTLTADGSSISSFLSRPDIAATLESLRLGKGRPDVPVLVAHTTLDDVVPYAQGRDFARSWCRNGAKVSFQPSLAPTHIGGAVSSFPKAFAFFEARVAGLPAVSNCGLF